MSDSNREDFKRQVTQYSKYINAQGSNNLSEGVMDDPEFVRHIQQYQDLVDQQEQGKPAANIPSVSQDVQSDELGDEECLALAKRWDRARKTMSPETKAQFAKLAKRILATVEGNSQEDRQVVSD